jgi:hypothetical protein
VTDERQQTFVRQIVGDANDLDEASEHPPSPLDIDCRSGDLRRPLSDFDHDPELPALP